MSRPKTLYLRLLERHDAAASIEQRIEDVRKLFTDLGYELVRDPEPHPAGGISCSIFTPRPFDATELAQAIEEAGYLLAI